MLLSSLDYPLPHDRIAQTPARPRDAAKCLVVERATGKVIADTHMRDLPRFLNMDDLLVRNESTVFKARLSGHTTQGKNVEVFLVRPHDASRWVALLRPGKAVRPGESIIIANHAFTLEEKNDADCLLHSPLSIADTFALAQRVGSVPIPPYIDTPPPTVAEDYQTVFARPTAMGSVAAPTAGLHFTPELLASLAEHRVGFASVVLHVGLGTFLPVKTERVAEHTMHAEWAELPTETVQAIAHTKEQGKRVVAVGTTSMRTLEGFATRHQGTLHTTTDFLTTFILPGWHFRVADGLLTNFHMPKTTLLALVAAFLEPNPSAPGEGLRRLHHLYRYALEHQYRFASFGDGMLIL